MIRIGYLSTFTGIKSLTLDHQKLPSLKYSIGFIAWFEENWNMVRSENIIPTCLSPITRRRYLKTMIRGEMSHLIHFKLFLQMILLKWIVKIESQISLSDQRENSKNCRKMKLTNQLEIVDFKLYSEKVDENWSHICTKFEKWIVIQ